MVNTDVNLNNPHFTLEPLLTLVKLEDHLVSLLELGILFWPVLGVVAVGNRLDLGHLDQGRDRSASGSRPSWTRDCCSNKFDNVTKS